MLPALIPIIIGILLSNIDKRNSKEIIKNLTKEHIVIRLPNVYLWIGCLDISFFVTCLFVMTRVSSDTATIWVNILFILFVLLGVVIVFETQIWKIEIFKSKNYFVYSPFPFKIYTIQYSNCISFKLGINSLVLKTNKQTIHIDNKATNFEFLLVMLIQHKVNQIQSGDDSKPLKK